MLEGRASEIGLAAALGTRGLVSHPISRRVGEEGSPRMVAGKMAIKMICRRLD